MNTITELRKDILTLKTATARGLDTGKTLAHMGQTSALGMTFETE